MTNMFTLGKLYRIRPVGIMMHTRDYIAGTDSRGRPVELRGSYKVKENDRFLLIENNLQDLWLLGPDGRIYAANNLFNAEVITDPGKPENTLIVFSLGQNTY